MGYKDPEKQREFNREWVRERRLGWIVSQGGRCVKCGSTERLEVDHIDPATKCYSPAAIWSLCEEKRLVELAKCQVLCYVCHKAKTIYENMRVPVHGTVHAYHRMKCRCDECRAAHSTEWAEYVRKRREEDPEYRRNRKKKDA